MSPGGHRGTLWTAGLALLMVSVGWAGAVGAQVSPEPYHNYQTMKEDMRALAEEHPEIATFEVHGESQLGNELYHVDVANDIQNRSDEELARLPTLYVDGLHHGNEILSGEAVYYFLERVLANATENATYLEGKRLVVNPVVNADGFLRDQRENANGVDLNRNYPFHWGRYGTSDAPFTGTYRGPEPASETETQANMALMESLNLYGYVTGHTGTYDIVLPWRQSEDGEIPDWPLYETTLNAIENETGLEYRDPSGAGEAHAWAYGNRSALGLLPEVSEEQSAPASTEDVEQRLHEVLQVYRITWENLTHLGGELHLQDVNGTEVTVHNDGWGPAYDLVPVPQPSPETRANTTGNATDNATDDGAAADPRDVGSGATATLAFPEGTEAIRYERVTIDGDDPQVKVKTLSLPASLNATEDGPVEDDGLLAIPGPGFAALAAALAGLALARRPRR